MSGSGMHSVQYSQCLDGIVQHWVATIALNKISQLMLLFVLRYFVSATVCCLSIRARLRPIKTKTVDLCLEPMH